MEGFIVVIAIIVAAINAVNKGKNVKKNAPGRAAKPLQPATPSSRPVYHARPESTQRPATPTAPEQPVQTDFWNQVAELLETQKSAGQGVGTEARKDAQGATGSSAGKPKGHEAISDMSEGDSRICEHGSIGGSIAYDEHDEGLQRQTAAERKKSAPLTQPSTKPEETPLYRPAMNAQQMRQAVVMAEILKRPQERMAQWTRRWSA